MIQRMVVIDGKIAYNYDLVSGKVNWVGYQPGQPDAFYHRYFYDAENRLNYAQTSDDSIYWEQDAYYEYYRHGRWQEQFLVMKRCRV